MANRNNRLSKWWKTEREKISGIPGTSKKIGYIWEYYKLWIIGIVLGIWFITFAVRQYTTTLKDYWCYMVFANTYADAGDHSDLWEDYVEYAGFDLTEKAVRFDAASYFDTPLPILTISKALPETVILRPLSHMRTAGRWTRSRWGAIP